MHQYILIEKLKKYILENEKIIQKLHHIIMYYDDILLVLNSNTSDQDKQYCMKSIKHKYQSLIYNSNSRFNIITLDDIETNLRSKKLYQKCYDIKKELQTNLLKIQKQNTFFSDLIQVLEDNENTDYFIADEIIIPEKEEDIPIDHGYENLSEKSFNEMEWIVDDILNKNLLKAVSHLNYINRHMTDGSNMENKIQIKLAVEELEKIKQKISLIRQQLNILKDCE